MNFGALAPVSFHITFLNFIPIVVYHSSLFQLLHKLRWEINCRGFIYSPISGHLCSSELFDTLNGTEHPVDVHVCARASICWTYTWAENDWLVLSFRRYDWPDKVIMSVYSPFLMYESIYIHVFSTLGEFFA